ncbi:MAG: TRAP transporter large permease, partial [Clostridia bacterium]|nr:TRAP transporter large permease [Clostridia bacterium]
MILRIIILFVMLFGFMALGTPVASAMLFSSFIYMWAFDINIFSAVVSAMNAPMSQTLLSVGFFILAGNLMNNGGVTRKIFKFAKDIVGWIPGGLGHANVVASVIFAGMSGSATADAGGLGAIEVKAMTDEGYDMDFSLAVTGASTILSPIIPPSIPAVLLACLTGVSTGRLFTGGIIPGFIFAVFLMATVYVIALKRGYPRTPFPGRKAFWRDFMEAFFPLLTPIIILGSIYTGIVTPTEAAVLAGFYAVILGLISRDLKLRDLPRIFAESGKLLISILFITVAARIMQYIITIEQIPAIIANALIANVNSPVVFLIIEAAILLILGCVMDGTATIFIVTPILWPIAQQMGVDPIQFCIVFSFTLMVGVITPPFGMVLFVLQGMSGID